MLETLRESSLSLLWVEEAERQIEGVEQALLRASVVALSLL